MSEQEQDIVLGRFLREHSDAKRKLIVMNAELERYAKAFTALGGSLAKNMHDDFNLNATRRDIEALPLSGFDFSKLLAFLEEYTEVRKSISAGKTRLRELGVDAV